MRFFSRFTRYVLHQKDAIFNVMVYWIPLMCYSWIKRHSSSFIHPRTWGISKVTRPLTHTDGSFALQLWMVEDCWLQARLYLGLEHSPDQQDESLCFSILVGHGQSHTFRVELATDLAIWEKFFQRAVFLEVQRIRVSIWSGVCVALPIWKVLSAPRLLREKRLLQQSSFIMFVFKVSIKDRTLQKYSWRLYWQKISKHNATSQTYFSGQWGHWMSSVATTPTVKHKFLRLSRLSLFSCYYVENNANDLLFLLPLFQWI